jgi:hypothetical protein
MTVSIHWPYDSVVPSKQYEVAASQQVNVSTEKKAKSDEVETFPSIALTRYQHHVNPKV